MFLQLSHINAFLDLVNHVIFKPFDTLSILPEAFLWCLRIFVAMVCSETMLLSLVPPTFIKTAISPLVAAEALLLVADKLSVVSHFICVLIHTVAVHVIFRPLSVVALSI